MRTISVVVSAYILIMLLGVLPMLESLSFITDPLKFLYGLNAFITIGCCCLMIYGIVSEK